MSIKEEKTVYTNWKGGQENLTIFNYLPILVLLFVLVLVLVFAGFTLPFFLQPQPIVRMFKFCYYKLFTNKYIGHI